MPEEISGATIPNEMRVLLLQVRDSPEVAEHECYSLRSVSGLGEDQIQTINLVFEPRVAWERVRAADAVVIGGAGVHSAVEDDPFTDDLIALIQRMVDERVNLFGSCYGHQMIARALGGSVVHDEHRAEVGAIEVTATEAGRRDPLFGACPARYTVLMGHQDRVDRLPDSAVELAFSDKCRNQAFRIDGAPVWGAQFHAELTPERLMERLNRYRHYAPDASEYERIKRSLRTTPEAQEILHRFLYRCVSGGNWLEEGAA